MTALSLDDLAALERLAKGATPGPWYVYRPSKLPHLRAKTSGHYIMEHGNGPRSDPDANFIAAANPQTISSLISQLRAAMEAAVAIRGVLRCAHPDMGGNHQYALDHDRKRVASAVAALDAVITTGATAP